MSCQAQGWPREQPMPGDMLVSAFCLLFLLGAPTPLSDAFVCLVECDINVGVTFWEISSTGLICFRSIWFGDFRGLTFLVFQKNSLFWRQAKLRIAGEHW